MFITPKIISVNRHVTLNKPALEKCLGDDKEIYHPLQCLKFLGFLEMAGLNSAHQMGEPFRPYLNKLKSLNVLGSGPTVQMI